MGQIADAHARLAQGTPEEELARLKPHMSSGSSRRSGRW